MKSKNVEINEIKEIFTKSFIKSFKEGVDDDTKKVIDTAVREYKVTKKLAESVIAVYRDFETENKSGNLHQTSSLLEKGLNIYLEKNPEEESKLISKIESYLTNLPLPKGVDAAKATTFKNDLAKIGLDTLRVELKVFNINQETKSLNSHVQVISATGQVVFNFSIGLM